MARYQISVEVEVDVPEFGLSLRDMYHILERGDARFVAVRSMGRMAPWEPTSTVGRETETREEFERRMVQRSAEIRERLNPYAVPDAECALDTCRHSTRCTVRCLEDRTSTVDVTTVTPEAMKKMEAEETPATERLLNLFRRRKDKGQS